MAEYRTVKMSFWIDPYTEDLEPSEKLLYLYLFTCPHTNNLGLLEVSVKRIAFESGLDRGAVQAALDRLEVDGKIIVDGSEIWISRFIKNQTSTSEKIIQGLRNLLPSITSSKISDALYERYPHIFEPSARVKKEKENSKQGVKSHACPIDTVSIDPEKPMDTSSKPIDTHPMPPAEKEREEEREEEEEPHTHTSLLDSKNNLARVDSGDEERRECEERNPSPSSLSKKNGPKKLDSPSKSHPSWHGFMSCWQVYPIKQSREDAWREWCRLEENGTIAPAYAIRDAIVMLTQEDDRWQEGFAPKMARWLNSKGWEDEPFKRPDNGAGGQADFMAQVQELRKQKRGAA